MSARSLAKATSTTQADAAVKTSLLKHVGVKQKVAEPKQQLEEWAKRNSNPKSSFKHDFSRIPVSAAPTPVVQPKLVLGHPNDRYEQEADQVADQVIRMPEPVTIFGRGRVGSVQSLAMQRLKADTSGTLQRQAEESEALDGEEVLQAKFLPSLSIKPLTAPFAERVQRQSDELQAAQPEEEEEEEPVQAKFLSSLPIQPLSVSSEETVQRQMDDLQEAQEEEDEEKEATVQAKGIPSPVPQVTSSLASRLKKGQGKGRPLPTATREFMESRFNRDFSRVRVHTDGQANQLARDLKAQALTFKQDIYFGAGYYQPHTQSGKRLLAHELTHTIQQQPAPVLRPPYPAPFPSAVSQRHDATEHEAESVAHQIAQNAPVPPGTISEGSLGAQQLISLRRNNSQVYEPPVFSLGLFATAEAKLETPNGAASSSKLTSLKKAGGKATVGTKTGAESRKDTEKEDDETKGAVEDSKIEDDQKEAEKSEAALEAETAKEAEKAPASPDEDPAFQETLKQINRTQRTQRKHPAASAKVGEVKQAAVLTEKEQENENDRKQHLEAIGQTAEESEKEDQPFKPETFQQLLQQNLAKIEKQLPTDEDKAKQFKKDKPLEEVKQDIGRQVSEENRKVAAPMTSQVTQPPPKSGLPTKSRTELQKDSAGPRPRPINPQAATPKPKQDSEISMEKESQSLDDFMTEKKMTEEQLAESNEPTFVKALDTKKQAQQEAEAAPERYRQQEEKILAGAQKKAHSTGQREFGNMLTSRKTGFSQVLVKQQDTEKQDIAKQQAVKVKLEEIYNKTKEDVNGILDDLSEKVESKFETEVGKAQKAFEKRVEDKLDDIYGWFTIDEAIFGKSDEQVRAIKETFESEKEKFVSAMKGTLKEISELIADKLNKAVSRIKEGRKKTQDFFNGLSKEQQKLAEETMTSLNSRYDTLEESVKDKEKELAETLAESYSTNEKSLKETFDKIEKEVSATWIGKAVGFLKDVAVALAKLADLLFSVLKRLAYLIGDIISHPIRFFKNLAAGFKAGFGKFISGIEGYLVGGFFDWLRGSVGGPGIKIPDKFDAAGIFSLVTQVLALDYQTFRKLAVKSLGKQDVELLEKGVAGAEKGLEIFKTVKEKGLIVLWEDIKQMILSNIDDTMARVKKTILFETVKKALAFIGSLFTPAGAFIKAVQLLYKGLRFLVDNIDRIRDMVNAFMDSLELAVKGNVGRIADKIIKALQNFIVLAIDFLAKLLNLGNLGKKVRKILATIRKPVIRGMKWLLKKLRPRVKRALRKVKKLIKKGKAVVKKAKKKARVVAGKIKKKGKAAAKKAKEKVLSLIQWWTKKKTFKDKTGKNHQLYYKGKSESARIYVASFDPTMMEKFFASKMKEAASDSQANFTTSNVIDAKNYYDTNIVPLESKLRQVDKIYKTGPGAKQLSTEKKAKGINENKKLVQNLERVLSELSNKHLKKLFGATTDDYPPPKLPVMADNKKASSFTADYIVKGKKFKVQSGTESGQHVGNLDGWPQLQAAKLTDQSRWVRMHLLPHKLGGNAVDSNLTPARGPRTNIRFSHAVEQPAIKAAVEGSEDKNKPIWYRFRIGYYSGKASPFPKYLKAEWGHYESKDSKFTRGPAVKSLKQTPAKPEFTPVTPNLNDKEVTLGEVAAVSGVDRGFVELLFKVRKENGGSLGKSAASVEMMMEKKYVEENASGERQYRFGVEDFDNRLNLVLTAIRSSKVVLK